MSDEFAVCLTILVLAVFLGMIMIAYLLAAIAVTKVEEYQKNDEKIKS